MVRRKTRPLMMAVLGSIFRRRTAQPRGPLCPLDRTSPAEPAMSVRWASRGQRVLDQLDPVGGAEHDRLVVEIIGGVMQPCAVAVAAEDQRTPPLLQHEGEIFAGHQR